MGNWQLEIFKFSLYVFAPVSAFYAFHRIDWFRPDIEKYHRRIYSDKVLEASAQLKADLELIHRKRELDAKRKMEASLVDGAAATK